MNTNKLSVRFLRSTTSICLVNMKFQLSFQNVSVKWTFIVWESFKDQISCPTPFLCEILEPFTKGSSDTRDWNKLWWYWSSYRQLKRQSDWGSSSFTTCNSFRVRAPHSTKYQQYFKSLYQQIIIRLGGIIPPIARDLHAEHISRIVETALENARLQVKDLDAIAVTVKPGMPLSLLIGTKFAKDLCRKWSKPLIPIHHMEAHALTARMVEKVCTWLRRESISKIFN